MQRWRPDSSDLAAHYVKKAPQNAIFSAGRKRNVSRRQDVGRAVCQTLSSPYNDDGASDRLKEVQNLAGLRQRSPACQIAFKELVEELWRVDGFTTGVNQTSIRGVFTRVEHGVQHDDVTRSVFGSASIELRIGVQSIKRTNCRHGTRRRNTDK